MPPRARPGRPFPHRTRADAPQAAPRRAFLRATLATLLTLFALGEALAQDPGELTIDTPRGAHRFTVELAATPDARARGLMFRQRMNPDHGMLFDFQTEQNVAFWMKNTPLPLDILFIDAAGSVIHVAADTVPFSEAPIPSRGPVRGVLEVNAGTAARLGIAPGAAVRHPIFRGG